ncbi:MAG TPA: hypothetical protein VKQ27_19725 [Acetobacteraceae bacterium]|nr:hypothetical protein [Acetobacteraceae bacterium]
MKRWLTFAVISALSTLVLLPDRALSACATVKGQGALKSVTFDGKVAHIKMSATGYVLVYHLEVAGNKVYIVSAFDPAEGHTHPHHVYIQDNQGVKSDYFSEGSNDLCYLVSAKSRPLGITQFLQHLIFSVDSSEYFELALPVNGEYHLDKKAPPP